MTTPNANSHQEILKLQTDLQHKKRELTVREEQFASEKLVILKEIAIIKRQASDEDVSKQTTTRDSSTDNQDMRNLQIQLENLENAIQEKKTEDDHLNKLTKAKSEELAEIMTKIRENSRTLPSKGDYDLLRTQISESKHMIRELQTEVEHRNRRIAGLKEQSERISLGTTIQTQFKSGNFAPSVPDEVVDFSKAKFAVAKRLWLDARNSYPADVIKYLKYGISAFLCSVDMYYAVISLQIPKPSHNLDDFTERVRVLSKANIRIRWSLAESLLGMLVKMERGIDVVPQPSYVNEIRAFLDEIADLFNLEGVNLAE
ncbi:MAG: hypothetical protein ACXAB4_14215 [Candidatus Hodarchaeales archaeon]|jgi:hypothetical protein